MSEEPSKDSSVKSTIEAVAGLVKAVPIYDDALQPAAKQIGKSLETITKAVNIALAPIKGLVWGYERIEGWVSRRLAEKLRNVDDSNIVTPLPQVAGPAIEALRYVGHDDNLRELYANLIAAAMDKDTVSKAHPGYVEILKNLCSDEALLLKIYVDKTSIPAIHIKGSAESGAYNLHWRYFNHIDKLVDLVYPDLISSYLDNLIRLGLVEVPAFVSLSSVADYEALETDPGIETALAEIVDSGREVLFERVVIRLTVFGAHFVKNVVVEKS